MSKSTRTRTARLGVRTHVELQEAMRQAKLSHEEERVLRMRHGLAVPASTPLGYRAQEHPELAAKLAFIERDALQALEAMRAPAPVSAEKMALQQAIIDRLKRLS